MHDSLVERVPGWWVAVTSPGKTLKFSSQLKSEHYLPMQSDKRPLLQYVFIRAVGPVGAWMLAGFKGWLLTNGKRAEVTDVELQEFRSTIERYSIPRAPKKQSRCRVVRSFAELKQIYTA